MLKPETAALVLAPMEGITDAPMRALQGASGAFSFAVSEFLRVAGDPIPAKVFLKDVPELRFGGVTPTGMPVQLQLLGGDANRMAQSAVAACQAGARAVDINFGCPAKTVNRHDGGASLLKHPARIREIVAAVRDAVPVGIPVSAKLRLGWDSIDCIHVNAEMAAEGGASWLTIHARTRVQGYAPPVFWPHIGEVRRALGLPIVANGDIWNLDDFHRCQDETGCRHFMIGRGALANPALPRLIARELGLLATEQSVCPWRDRDWIPLLESLINYTDLYGDKRPYVNVLRFKQWLKLARNYGQFRHFDAIKETRTLSEFFDRLTTAIASSNTHETLSVLV
jgi:tRNA-dihydrouridine synthase C